MSDEPDYGALVALLAKSLLPEAQDEMPEAEAEKLMNAPVVLSDDEKTMLARFNPLWFLAQGRAEGGVALSFPSVTADLPRAVGFYRNPTASAFDTTANAAILRKRKDIVDRRRREKGDLGGRDQ